MTLGEYCLGVAVCSILYAIGIAFHGEIKSIYQEIEQEMINAKSTQLINRASPLSYPFFLANKRARTVYWVINGFYSIVALIALVLWFVITIGSTLAKGIGFSDPVDVINDFGPFGVVQPVILSLALILLVFYGIEAMSFRRWRK